MNYTAIREYFEKRFTKLENGCWEWKGTKLSEKRGGYGSFVCRPLGINTSNRAHRISFQIYNLVDLLPDQHVLHKCDNVLCVNPNHLFLGDQAVNMADKVSKFRQSRGENHGKSKLNECDVLKIRERISFGEKACYLAFEYSVTQQTICDIKHRRSWNHI